MSANSLQPTVIFDKSALVRMLMGDEVTAAQIVAEFVQEASEQVLAMGCAVQEGDAPSLHRLGHTMKGAAANVGAFALSEAFRQLEEAGLAGDLEEAASAARCVEEGLEELKLALRNPQYPAAGIGQ